MIRFPNKTILIATVIALLGLSASLQGAADLCTGAVDPYDIVAEKGRFYSAAGKDNELSATEFAAIQIGPTGFRRKFDKWSEMLKFDSDANKSLDWMEAGAYRLAMGRKVLEAYDANLDGKLTGAERDSACKALASGKIRFDAKPKSSGPDPHLAEHERRKKLAQKSEHRSDHRRPHEKPDPDSRRRIEEKKHHDRGGNDAEAQKRKDATMMQYGYWIEKYDKDGDGQLNAAEKAAAKAAYHRNFTTATPQVRATSQAKLDEWRRRYKAKMAARKSGWSRPEKTRPPTVSKTSKPPTAPRSGVSEEEQAQRANRKAEIMEKYDTDRDGKDEKTAYIRDIKARKAERDKERVKKPKPSDKQKPHKAKPPKSHKKRSRKGR
ncbi:MAG: hypothetical protein QGG25_06515 [Phycisphaerae bacterium]|nr:hypothetical protein [Phycisphaerae bacterium]